MFFRNEKNQDLETKSSQSNNKKIYLFCKNINIDTKKIKKFLNSYKNNNKETFFGY